jgi:hypothetical protein
LEEKVINIIKILGNAINFVTPDEKEDLENLQKFYGTTIEALPTDLSEIK